jgi:parallel beta-helix repeat protein
LLYGSGNDCEIDNNYIKTSDNDGIRIEVYSNCVIHHNTIVDSAIFGLNLVGADNTLVYENFFMNNSNHANDNGFNNEWNNTVLGNYWDDYLGYDMNLDGIGDTPYGISGIAGASDYLPIWNLQEPIVINDLPSSLNNWTWAVAQPWCSGSGTELDPYVLEGLNIDANETDGCIAIWHSTAYFIIQNCYLMNSSGSDAGVFLTNVTNGRIIGNEFYNHRNAGVFGTATDFIIVEANSFENHQHGVFLSGSYNEILSNTIFGDGTGSGIIIQFSSAFHDNLIDGNIIENCWQGIFIFDSENNTISHNTAVRNLNFGIAVTGTADNNLFIGNTLLNNFLSGIIIDNSINNTIVDTKAIGNQQHGIHFTNVDYTIIYHNRLIDNVMDGIHLATGSTNNLIYRNFFGNNGRHAYDDGAFNDWNFTTIGNYWDNHTGPDTSPADGIVDTPYTYIAGGAGSVDYLPIAEDGPPVIIINSPLAGETFGAIAPSFIVTVTDAFILDMWYSFDAGLTKFFFTTNGTIDQTVWDSLPEGTLTITFFANDTAGNVASETVSVVKALPEDNSLLLILIISISIVSGIAVITAIMLIRRRKARKQS